jgi:DNA polymerase III alpha subunit
VCKLANIPIPTIREMDNLLDEKTFDIYKNGLTSTINQADSDFATGLVTKYCPKSVSEMSAFVAIIRPGCASLLQDFIGRKPYTTGVEELDEILIEGNHRMIYQELIMKYLIWLGIPETGSYDIIKKIAKKKFKEAELELLKKQLLDGWKKRVEREKGFTETWTVVEQAAKYSFNASHSLSYAYDSLYGAYLKSHYPLEYYTVALNYYGDDSVRTLKLTNELSFFGIELKPIKFRYSKSDYSLSREDNSIYKGIQSIKNMNSKVADEIYELKNNKYNSFTELLFDIKNKTTINQKQLRILIELDFFAEFGDINLLLAQMEFFNKFSSRSQFKKNELATLGISLETIRPFATKETEKMFTGVNFPAFVRMASKEITAPSRKLSERIKSQIDYLGYITIVDNKYSRMAAVLSVDTKYSPKLKMYSLKNGTTLDCKIDKKTFNKEKLSDGDIVRISGTKNKPKVRKNADGEWETIQGTSELWITAYHKVENL